MIIEIVNQNQLLAIVIKSRFQCSGIRFFTPNYFSQQLAYMNHPAGHKIPAHLHNQVPRAVDFTKEVLLIKSGLLRVDFYDPMKNYLESVILGAGDVILLAYGGHGFEVLEPTEMIEVKQGPYVGPLDKITFPGIDPSKIKIRSGEA